MKKITVFLSGLAGFTLAIAGLGLIQLAAAQSSTPSGSSSWGQFGCHRSAGFLNNTTKQVTNTDTGVVITMTSDDADTVQLLQDKNYSNPTDDAFNTTKEDIDNGIKITLSTTDPAQVTELQNMAAAGKFPFFGHMGRKGLRGGMMGNFGALSNTNRQVTNTADGVAITITSTDANTVTMLQNKAYQNPTDGKYTVIKSNITDGITVTFSSSDPAEVTQLQTMAAANKFPFGGGHRGGMWRGMNKSNPSQ